MPVYLIYKDFTMLPLRMLCSPNNAEELELKVHSELLCGVINNRGLCVTSGRGDRQDPRFQ